MTGAFFGYTRQSNPPTRNTMAYKRSGGKKTGKEGPGSLHSETTHKKYSVNYQNGKKPKYNGQPYDKNPY